MGDRRFPGHPPPRRRRRRAPDPLLARPPARFVPGRTLAVRLQSAGSLKGHAVDLAPAPAPAPAPEPEKPKILKPPDEVPPPPTEKAKLLPAKEDAEEEPSAARVLGPEGQGEDSRDRRAAPEQPAAAAGGTGADGAGTEAGPGTGVGVGRAQVRPAGLQLSVLLRAGEGRDRDQLVQARDVDPDLARGAFHDPEGRDDHRRGARHVERPPLRRPGGAARRHGGVARCRRCRPSSNRATSSLSVLFE